MNPVLTNLFKLLSDNRSPIVEHLLPGLNRQKIIERLNEVIKTAPEDLVELYSWKNGTQFPEKSKVLFDYIFHFHSLELAIEDYEAFQKLDPNINFGISFENLFPIFLSGGGEYYFYCFSGSDKGKIFYNSPGEFLGETVTAFMNLEQMFTSIYECYDRSIYYFDENGRFKVNGQIHEELMKSLNQDCQKWNGEEIDSELLFINLK
jgi:hypothetical protein